MNDKLILAYLAGCIDSDGYITIKKSTYSKRHGESVNAGYWETIGLRQVTSQVPELLKQTFGGHIYISKGHSENSKPLYNYRSANVIAFNIAKSLLPYLRIKTKQAEILLELRESKNPKYKRSAYWFQLDFPNWESTCELITVSDVMGILGYGSRELITQAIHKGTLLTKSLPRSGRKEQARIPLILVNRIAENRKLSSKENSKRKGTPQAPELVAWRESLYQQTRELNKIGLNGTSVYHKSGHHSLK